MAITPAEIAETRGMVEEQNLDIRTITMGVSLMGCGDENLDRMCTKIYDHVTHTAEHLVETAENLEREYGIPIVNKRVSVTPVAQIAACCKDEDLTPIAHALDRAAETLGIDYLGGFSALVQKGIGDADRRVIQSIPQALATTSRVCSSVNVASLRAGINMDAVLMAAQTIIDAAKLTADEDSVGASKFVCFANMVEDSPFMAGAVHGGGEADAVINVGVSGPGVMAAALETLPDSASMMEVAEKIKQTAFKITRAGELMSREAAHRLGVEKGIVDLSLAPTPAIGDSVARILEIIGVGTCGGPGTTCALAMLRLGWQVAVTDPSKGANDFRPIRDRLIAFEDSLEGCYALLQWAEGEMKRRARLIKENGGGDFTTLPDGVRPKPLLLFIDETNSLLGEDERPLPNPNDDPELENANIMLKWRNGLRHNIGLRLSHLLTQARSAGIAVLLGAQQLKAGSLDALPAASTCKEMLGRVFLGNGETAGNISTAHVKEANRMLRQAGSMPKGRGLYEPMGGGLDMVQCWWSGMGDELVANADGIPTAEPIDLSDHMPVRPDVVGAVDEPAEEAIEEDLSFGDDFVL